MQSQLRAALDGILAASAEREHVLKECEHESGLARTLLCLVSILRFGKDMEAKDLLWVTIRPDKHWLAAIQKVNPIEIRSSWIEDAVALKEEAGLGGDGAKDDDAALPPEATADPFLAALFAWQHAILGYLKAYYSLSKAVRAGGVELCITLIAQGANLETKNDDGRTPLHVAVVSGHFKIAKALLSAGANFRAVDSEPGGSSCKEARAAAAQPPPLHVVSRIVVQKYA